ncbi:uncharacterized protein LOC122265988 [Penaeus japonicus]|uniref:uncharacterized protein LOC122265988 n=1 Tax=Penaeus japonicus TaxID=27405 RepID=UPI001C70BD61|nr:uncharacterized protein LOC122265988 [Penaeus japonicus]
MPVMTSCCCCFSTKVGSILIGAISLVVSFCAAVGFCFGLINIDEAQHQLKVSVMNYQGSVTANVTEDRLKVLEDIIGLENIVDHIQTIFIVGLVYYGIYTFASLFMTYGSCTSIRVLLLPWLVLEFVPLAAQVASIIALFMYGKDDPTLSQGGAYIISGLLCILAFVIHVYWWMCPVALYQSLKEETVVEPLVPPSHPMYPVAFMKY